MPIVTERATLPVTQLYGGTVGATDRRARWICGRSISRIDRRGSRSSTVVKTLVRSGMPVMASLCLREGPPHAGSPRLDVMTVRRVMGLETEYGVTQPGDPAANAMVMSGQVVNAYAQPLGHRVGKARWDYEDEAPLRDARGFEINRDLADPSQLTDTEDPTLANVILTNGARLYVDHAHPEYSSPEVTTPAGHRALGQGGGADHARPPYAGWPTRPACRR